MATAAEMAKVLNKVATWFSYKSTSSPAQWNVYILDARVSWGKVQYLLIPVSGEGAFWADEDKVAKIRESV